MGENKQRTNMVKLRHMVHLWAGSIASACTYLNALPKQSWLSNGWSFPIPRISQECTGHFDLDHLGVFI
jgi:hypothetical protein